MRGVRTLRERPANENGVLAKPATQFRDRKRKLICCRLEQHIRLIVDVQLLEHLVDRVDLIGELIIGASTVLAAECLYASRAEVAGSRSGATMRGFGAEASKPAASDHVALRPSGKNVHRTGDRGEPSGACTKHAT